MQAQAAIAPRRRGRPSNTPPQFPGKIIRFDSRPRLIVGDVVELCGKALPGNLGKTCIITGFLDDGRVELQSISGALDSRNMETNEITRESSIFGRIEPQCCYRLSRDLAKGYRHA